MRLPGPLAKAAQQQVGNGHDHQQSVQAVSLGDLSVAQVPAVAFALVVAE